MPGRGRGRGTGLSFSTESLGFARGDVLPAAVLAPPPTYPQLSNKPVKLSEDEYCLKKAEELRSHFRSSKYFLSSSTDLKVVEEFDWDFLPQELKPVKTKRKHKKRESRPNLVKRKQVDVDTKLKELESKEATNKGDDSDKDIAAEESDSDEEDRKTGENVSDIEDPDDEMDGGTDYASNYFDNGEGYEDGEDDNLDEGGIY